MDDWTDLHLALTVNDQVIPSYATSDASSRSIHFYPSASFAIHIFIPASFEFLADILILDVSMADYFSSTFHIRPSKEGEKLEGVIRSPGFVFPPEPHDYGHIDAKLWHARVCHGKIGGSDQFYSAVEQWREREFESVVDVSSMDSTALGVVTPIRSSSQGTLGFKWTFRPLDSLRGVVQGAKRQPGPGWAREDEGCCLEEAGNVVGDAQESVGYKLRQLRIDEGGLGEEEGFMDDEGDASVRESCRDQEGMRSDDGATVDVSSSSDTSSVM